MARDFIFRIKNGEALPPIDPSGYRLLLNDETGELKLLTAEKQLIDIPTTASTSSNGSGLGISSFTYNNANKLSINFSSGGSLSADINILTGLTIDGSLIVSEIIASSYKNLPPFTGGTITGNTTFTNGINTDSISASTYYNFPQFTGGTVTGNTIFTDGLASNTISASTYYNLPLDIFVTGGTYTSGEITLRRNDGTLLSITGLPIGGNAGQLYYFNTSNAQAPYREFSANASDAPEESTTISVNSGATSTIQSFLTPDGYPNAVLMPGGVWTFYLHAYKEDISSSFEIFCEIYKRTTGGTETLLFATDAISVAGVSPSPIQFLTDAYFSGTSLNHEDRLLIKVKATNTGNSTKDITFVTEGSEHYSYGISTLSNSGLLTCANLSGCSVIQIIQSDLSNKINRDGDAMTGSLYVPTLSASTIEGGTFNGDGSNLVGMVTGLTYDDSNNITLERNGLSTLNITINNLTGLTINGDLSATTLYGDGSNLVGVSKTDIYTTGFTYLDNTFSITDNSGFTYSAGIDTMTGLTVNGDLSATTISADTFYGGTIYGDGSNLVGVSKSDRYTTGFTYLNNTFSITDNSGFTYSAIINAMTGLTVNGNLSATTLYGNGSNLVGVSKTDRYITGFTYLNNTFSITDNSGSTFTAGINTMTGLTINGAFSVTGNTTLAALTGSSSTITGLAKSATIQITSGATAGYVLKTIDSFGNAQWAAETSIVTTGITFWAAAKVYKTNDIVLAKYENEWRLWLALTGFTSSGATFPGGQTIATDLNSYTGQWQEISPFRGASTSVNFTGPMYYSASLTPPTLTGGNNFLYSDYSPSGLSTTNFLRISSLNNVNIGGLLAPSPAKNQGVYICNVGGLTITIKNEDPGSVAANRFLVGGDKNLQPNEGIMLIYDDISLRWRSQAIQI